MSTIINASTSSGLVQTADTSGTLALQSNGTTQFTLSSTGAYGQLKSATAQASTSGTAIDFTSIPSWVKRITVMLSGVSTSGTSNIQCQIGAGSVDISGYLSIASFTATSGTSGATAFTAGFGLSVLSASTDTLNGSFVISLLGSNTWVQQGNLFRDATVNVIQCVAGSKTLSGTLDRVRITTANGTDTFDAGSINILYEG
jgi:hypothetical protein